MSRRLLVIAHCPSDNTRALKDAILAGASAPEIEGVDVHWLAPLAAGDGDLLAAGALILLTPENLGYMSGALKDFFDRIYYPCLERTQGLSYALCIRAGHDGTGTRRAVETIVTGLKWRAVRPPLIWRGAWQPGFLNEAHDLGMAMAAGLEAGII